jgi:hypothetical protein
MIFTLDACVELALTRQVRWHRCERDGLIIGCGFKSSQQLASAEVCGYGALALAALYAEAVDGCVLVLEDAGEGSVVAFREVEQQPPQVLPRR